MSESKSPESRLNWLFAVVWSVAGQTYTARDVAQGVSEALGERDIRMLETAIDELRAGLASTVAAQAWLSAIAEFFGASSAYFGMDEEDLARAQIDLVWVELRRSGVERMRVCRTDDLDPKQWLALGVILLSCARSFDDGPEAQSAPKQGGRLR